MTSSAAAASDKAAHTETGRHSLSFTDQQWDPCLETMIQVSVEYEQLFHVTENSRGTHLHGKIRGTVTMFPLDDPDLVYIGTWGSLLNVNENRHAAPLSWNFRTVLSGSDGSRLVAHEAYHVTFVDGEPVVERERLRCHFVRSGT